MSDKKTEAEFYTKCLKLFITELKRIRTRFEKNRVKELQEIIKIDEEMEQTSEGEIQDAYGYGCYDEEEYDRRMKAYRDYQDEKERMKDMPTIQTQMTKIINDCISDCNQEIEYMKIHTMTPEEKEVYLKKQELLKRRRERRMKKITEETK